MQGVVVCYSELQCVIVCCSVLWCVFVCVPVDNGGAEPTVPRTCMNVCTQ